MTDECLTTQPDAWATGMWPGVGSTTIRECLTTQPALTLGLLTRDAVSAARPCQQRDRVSSTTVRECFFSRTTVRDDGSHRDGAIARRHLQSPQTMLEVVDGIR
jgi:hypothetical protein